MTFQQVVDTFRDAALVVSPTGSFIYGRGSDAANISELPYPRIHLLPFTQTRDPLELQKRTTEILMAFVKLDTGENDVAEREQIGADMEALCSEYLAELITTNEATVQFDSIKTEQLFNVYEGVSGYSLQLTIVTIDEC
jgi:hypothetical protein